MAFAGSEILKLDVLIMNIVTLTTYILALGNSTDVIYQWAAIGFIFDQSFIVFKSRPFFFHFIFHLFRAVTKLILSPFRSLVSKHSLRGRVRRRPVCLPDTISTAHSQIPPTKNRVCATAHSISFLSKH